MIKTSAAAVMLKKLIRKVLDSKCFIYIKKVVRKFLNSARPIKAAAACAAAIIVLFTCFIASGATVAYNISYEGQVIATVSNKKIFNAAVNLAVKEMGNDIKEEISSPEYSTVITVKSKLNTKDELKDAILENTHSLIHSTVLKVNGEEVAFIVDGDLNAYLEQYKNSFNIEGCESSSSFIDTIEVENGYFSTSVVYSLEDAKEVISKYVKVQTTATVCTEKSIAFKTVTQKSSSLMLGDSKVIRSGKKGVRINTDRVVYINGKETERTNIESIVKSEPEEQLVLVGTAKTLASASQRAEAYASGFIFPLDKNSGWQVTSYYGDGRGHKGVDIGAPYGTNIYAVAAGTVTYAGYKSDYGYWVIIDHGNGVSTVYAHASTLGVKAGDKVVAGETIALVGSTGISTGNHLHFEVRKGDTRLDPAPYIGLG